MGNEEHNYCRKEKEIATIFEKVNRMEKEVIGNGSGLVKVVPVLNDNVTTLTKQTIPDLQKVISGFHRFQENMEGQHEGKALIRRRTQWIIGLLVTVNLGLFVALITLISKMS